jgi:hypothetical protein
VLDWIEVDVVDMARVVFRVADPVLPKATLPDVSFAALAPSALASVIERTTGVQAPGERLLEEHPAGRKVRVVGRKRPESVQVLRQHHHGVDAERMLRLDRRQAGPKLGNVVDQVAGAAILQRQREEVGRGGSAGTDVAAHGPHATRWRPRRCRLFGGGWR